MKTNRIYLDQNGTTNSTTDIMKKLREKLNSNKTIDISIDNTEEGNKKTPSNHKQNKVEVIFSVSGETMEKTGIKDEKANCNSDEKTPTISKDIFNSDKIKNTSSGCFDRLSDDFDLMSNISESFYSESFHDFGEIHHEFCECSYCEDGMSGFSRLSNILQTPVQFNPPQIKLYLRSEEDYKKFGLIKDKNLFRSPSNITHELLPVSLKDDEKYKRKLFRFIRKPEFKNSKTDTYKLSRKYSEAFNYENSPYTGKRKKVNSVKKNFEAEHVFEDNNVKKNTKDNSRIFKFYSDKNIGFIKKWQVQLKMAEMDDDVETDLDQLKAAERHIHRELGEGIKFYLKNKKNVRNYALHNN